MLQKAYYKYVICRTYQCKYIYQMQRCDNAIMFVHHLQAVINQDNENRAPPSNTGWMSIMRAYELMV